MDDREGYDRNRTAAGKLKSASQERANFVIGTSGEVGSKDTVPGVAIRASQAQNRASSKR